MSQKIVLITGGSSGIGKSVGIHLKSKGFKVYGTTRSLSKHPGFDAFELLQLDVRKADTIKEAIDIVLEREGRIDVLVNNAGVGITGPMEETPHEEILKAFEINLHGPLHMIKAVLPHMRRQQSGLIINVTSIAGFMGLPYRGIYSASKGALGIAMEAMRMEIKGFGIDLTTVAPGDFATNIAAGRYHAPVLDHSPYRDIYANTLTQINQDVSHGSDPMLVARLVYKIIDTKRPKVHYKVGTFLQKFSLTLKNLLPDKVYEKLLLNHYKL